MIDKTLESFSRSFFNEEFLSRFYLEEKMSNIWEALDNDPLLIWLATRNGVVPCRPARLFACDCAKRAVNNSNSPYKDNLLSYIKFGEGLAKNDFTVQSLSSYQTLFNKFCASHESSPPNLFTIVKYCITSPIPSAELISLVSSASLFSALDKKDELKEQCVCLKDFPIPFKGGKR